MWVNKLVEIIYLFLNKNPNYLINSLVENVYFSTCFCQLKESKSVIVDYFNWQQHFFDSFSQQIQVEKDMFFS